VGGSTAPAHGDGAPAFVDMVDLVRELFVYVSIFFLFLLLVFVLCA
jgi:hypothetical protein